MLRIQSNTTHRQYALLANTALARAQPFLFHPYPRALILIYVNNEWWSSKFWQIEPDLRNASSTQATHVIRFGCITTTWRAELTWKSYIESPQWLNNEQLVVF